MDLNESKHAVLIGLLLLGLLALVVSTPCGDDTAAAPAPAPWAWAQYGIPQTTTPAAIPTARTDWAVDYHTNMLKTEKNPDLKLVFLGDSITMMWRTQSGFGGGTPVWEKYY